MATSSFGIAFDIDGVIYHHTPGLGIELIPGAKEAFAKLVDNKIPFTFLSNSSGQTEVEKVKLLQDLLGIEISEQQIILATTPFSELAPRFEHRRVLTVAIQEETANRLANYYGFKNHTSIHSYAKRNPHLCPAKKYEPASPATTAAAAAPEEPIEAIFIFESPGDWGEALQILLDILRSTGTPGREHESVEQPVPLFCGTPDFHFGATHSIPRLTNGAFLLCLQHVFEHATTRPLHIQRFGKPFGPVYDCAATRLAALAGTPLHQIYMVGDNPHSDIKGALLAGAPWYPILVRTGCFQGKDNDEEHPAMHVCHNVLDALHHVLEREAQRASSQ